MKDSPIRFRKRLLNIARALRESKEPEKFTMMRFGHCCCTPACALGHYASRKDLQHIFKLSETGTLRYIVAEGNFHPSHDVSYDEDRVLKHFNITSYESRLLFDVINGCGGAQTTVNAAKFIEGFVARKYPS